MWPFLVLAEQMAVHTLLIHFGYFFMPPHRMMPGAYSFSVFRTCIRGYVRTCVQMYVLLYECVYVRAYIRMYVILLDSG